MRLLFLILLSAASPALAQNANRGVDSLNQPVVSGNMAYVPNCPNWKSRARDSAAETDGGYGCAVNSNIAAMIADPQDLLRGRTDPLTGHDPDAAVRAVRAAKGVGAAAAAPAAPKGGS
jgi:pilus assembly protein CpaD